VWLATGHTDMRKGFDGLALLVQETLQRNPHSGLCSSLIRPAPSFAVDVTAARGKSFTFPIPQEEFGCVRFGRMARSGV
jgi:transposase